MFEPMRIAVVGDADFLLPLRALGVRVFAARTAEEARAVLDTLEKENCALCFLHQSFIRPLAEAREALGKKLYPVVVGFSDYREAADSLEIMIRELAVKATGSDALVKRKG